MAEDRDDSRPADRYLELLAAHRGLVEHDPQSNPVRLLAFDISHDLETGRVDVGSLAGLAKDLCDNALLERAKRLGAYVGQGSPDAALDGLEAGARAEAENGGLDFRAFAERWGRPAYGLVLTAHPTFALSGEMRRVLADLAADGAGDTKGAKARLAGLAHAPDPELSLELEHDETEAAIGNVQDALREVNTRLLRVARQLYPLQWSALTPSPMTLASWVGYDIDGRSDIRWWDSIRFRLDEKRRQLARLVAASTSLQDGEGAYQQEIEAIRRRLRAAAASALEEAAAFGADLSGQAAFVAAANRLTGEDPGRLTDAGELTPLVDRAIAAAPDDAAREDLVLLKSELVTYGLGTSHIHLRINAIQIQNAMRDHFDMPGEAALRGRLAQARVTELIDEVTPFAVNFGSLDHEQTTAKRQFMIVAQILKHIDAQTPIRFLIAESESPFTVLAAIYLAKMFGVEDRVDISPLFETPAALERGGRLIEQLLDNPAYLAYARRRGRIAIQTGFSDAGRFFGQVPAGLAIERLQIQLARHLARRGIAELEVVIFNTHGESAGRGCHPSGLKARQHYVMTPWARWNFAKAGIALKHESSFQGGDGFALLARPDLARLTVAGLLAAETPPAAMTVEDDPFYDDIAFSWDFYRMLRAWQQDLFESGDYRAVIGSFGTDLLHRTGSRQTRRDASGTPVRLAEDLGRIRAIPHNAVLQQLGYPANVVAGIGLSARLEFDRFVDLVRQSDRMGSVMQLVSFAKRQSSLTALAAHGAVFDAGFWVARADAAGAGEADEACLTLADLVGDNARFNAFSRLHNRLRTDAIFLHQALDEIGLESRETEEASGETYLLHALRLALIMRLALLAARLPTFSARGETTRASVLELVLAMRVDEAVDIIREVFPATEKEGRLAGLEEPSSYRTGEARGYPRIHADYIRPMEAIFRLLKDIGVGLSHRFGAYG